MDDVGPGLIEHHARDTARGSTEPRGPNGAMRGLCVDQGRIKAESDVRCPKPSAYLQDSATAARVEIHRVGHAPWHDSTSDPSEGEHCTGGSGCPGHSVTLPLPTRSGLEGGRLLVA